MNQTPKVIFLLEWKILVTDTLIGRNLGLARMLPKDRIIVLVVWPSGVVTLIYMYQNCYQCIIV